MESMDGQDIAFDFAANLLPFDPTDSAFQSDPYPVYRKGALGFRARKSHGYLTKHACKLAMTLE